MGISIKLFNRWDNKKKNSNCEKINNKCIQACNCDNLGGSSNNIIRYFDNDDLYKWEISVYLKLIEIDSHITPLITSKNYEICYELEGYYSLRNFLNNIENKKDEEIILILNEVYSFINTFKKYNFVHGNLHIDNIFIKKTNNLYDFRVIDYVNSYILNEKYKKYNNNSFKRTSFLGEYELKENKNFLRYWDFFTMYISLKMLFKNKVYNLFNLQNITESYIPNDIFDNMLKKIMKDSVYFPSESKFY